MYTMQNAAKDVLQDMTPGVKYTGRDLHKQIISRMRANGNTDDPYDSSTLRTVRRYAALFGVVCDKAGAKSKYIKETLL